MANVTGFAISPLVKLEVAPATGSTTDFTNTAFNLTYNWVVFTNPGTIAAQTVKLPANPVDGQTFLLSNFAAITALTFTPAVTGFTNASAMAAGEGMLIAYSTPSGVWFVANT